MSSEESVVDLSRYQTPPTQLLQANTGWANLGLGELKGRGELLLALAGRDVRARYKQTVLGVVWVVLQPLIGAGIFSFIFAKVANLKAPGEVPYFLWTFAGLTLWQSTANVLLRSGSSLVTNRALVGKVYFPRLVLPIATLLTVLIDFAVAGLVLVVLILSQWYVPGPEVLLVPVAIVLSWLLALGVGLIIAAAGVIYRDALHLAPVFVQFAMWGSAIMWPIQEVPADMRWILYLNPAVPLIETFRVATLDGGPLDYGSVPWAWLAYAAGFTLVSLLVGGLAFRRMERSFADVI